jgi:hypothetical protein
MKISDICREFQACIDLAEAAGCCGTKARYFANKQVLKLYDVNIFDTLGMTRKSKPNSDEILYAIVHGREPVTPAEILLDYPFTRLTTQEIVDMLDNFEDQGLIKFDGTAYVGA